MRKLFLFAALTVTMCLFAQLPMEGWQMHLAYNNVTRVENAKDKVYALSEGALFSVDKEEESIEYYNRLTGLSGTNIVAIAYAKTLDILVIAYANGYIDLMKDDEIINIPDLYNKTLSASKEVRNISVRGNHAYLSMDFGIIVLNLTKGEIADTYYIGKDAEATKVLSTVLTTDSIFAFSESTLYCASLKDNLIDYSYWQTKPTPGSGTIRNAVSFQNDIYMLRDSSVYVWNAETWQNAFPEERIYQMRISDNQLLALSPKGTFAINEDKQIAYLGIFFGAPDVAYDSARQNYWYALWNEGVTRWSTATSSFNQYIPVGPVSNTAYRMRFVGERLFVVPGGYAGVPYNRPGSIMWYEKGQWMNYTTASLRSLLQYDFLIDFCDIIGTPTDPTHFYVASYGNGLIEFRNNTFYKWHYSKNSPLNNLIAGQDEQYTRVDGLAFDSKGNLWMQDNSTSGIKILSPDGHWRALSNAAGQNHSRMRNLIIDNRNENVKYVFNAYQTAGIGIMDDNGTLDYEGDDRAAYVSGWVDEDGNNVNPTYMWCAAQDHNGALWAGTEAGVLKFPNPYSLLTSNACTRIKIAREDGSGLADYLLGEEIINTIAVDGANRIWFGTEGSGAYLMDLSDPQNITTVHHYTTDNSPLPSNTIISIAINPITGEVFFGTGGGLVSYQGDAAEGKEDYSTAYAYPNPVRTNFDGVITIAGLMDDTHVRITDNGGNLVYETKSNGSLAIWDGKNGRGERVSSGVYFAMCVTADGEHNTLVKILVMN